MVLVYAMSKTPPYSEHLYTEYTPLALIPVCTSNFPRRVSEGFDSDPNGHEEGDDDKVILEIGGPECKSDRYEDDLSTNNLCAQTFYHKKYDKTSPHQRALYRSDSPNCMNRLQCDSRGRVYVDHMSDDREDAHDSMDRSVDYLNFDLSSQHEGLRKGLGVRLGEEYAQQLGQGSRGLGGPDPQHLLRVDTMGVSWRERALQLERGCSQPLFTTPYGDIKVEIANNMKNFVYFLLTSL